MNWDPEPRDAQGSPSQKEVGDWWEGSYRAVEIAEFLKILGI